MKLLRCSNGHYYDGEKFDKCPHCNANAEVKESIVIEVNNMKQNNDFVRQAAFSTEDNNVADPVVGWLVCIEGAAKGTSYTLKSGKNFIGRNEGVNDIAVRGDSTVSREKHAVIIYEPKSRNFFAQPGESNKLFYVNDQVVLQAMPVKEKDVLLLGKAKLMFVPLCGPEFSWDD